MSKPRPRAAPLLGAERHRKLHRRLVERGSLRVAEEARLFNVSEETIRRDIKTLTHAGVADAVFGGAVLRLGAGLSAVGVPPVDERGRLEQAGKTAIGAVAASRIRSGQVVILDAGTTTLAVALHLRQHENLTVVTNSLAIAQVTAGIRTCVTYVIGGKLVTESLSMVGPQAERDLAQIRADWAFLGTAAIDPIGGFTSAEPYESEVKKAMIRAARSVAIVADHTKFGSRGFAAFAAPREVQVFFTTSGAPEAAARLLEEAGVSVEICPADVAPARLS